MATRSTIAVEHADGTVSAVYCHWDGYVEHNGTLLDQCYNSREQAEALIALGNISALCSTLDKTEFYGRDRGEHNQVTKKYSSISDYYLLCSEEYNYIFRNGQWFVDCYLTDGELITVQEALERIAAEEAD